MRNWILKLGLAAALAALPPAALAAGEVFKVETTGTEYCGDFDNSKFNANNNIDLYVKIVDGTEWDIDFSPLFETAIPVVGTSYYVKQRTVSFTGAQFFADNSFISMEGKLTLDAFGNVTRASGTFIQDSLVFVGCFSSGKWRTTQRLL